MQKIFFKKKFDKVLISITVKIKARNKKNILTLTEDSGLLFSKVVL